MTQGGGSLGPAELVARAAAIHLLVLDVDGVLTDGGLYYGPTGEALKRFHARDGHGLVLARLVGLPTALLTGRTSPMVDVRAQELQLAAVLQGKRDKSAALEGLLLQLRIPREACAYMGDDINDLGPLGWVGLAACPSDAVLEVRRQSHFVAQAAGGHGAVRELVELCLRASGRWDRALALARSPSPP